jgi:hypothetical protein
MKCLARIPERVKGGPKARGALSRNVAFRLGRYSFSHDLSRDCFAAISLAQQFFFIAREPYGA